jgi:oligopeptide transport system substrate-binding protein
VGLSGCQVASGEYFGKVTDPHPGHLRWCLGAEPEWTDPALATSTTDMKLVYAMFDGLTTHDPEGGPLPSLATHWEIAPDLKTFTFHLRKDAVWSSGRPITSADFLYSLYRVLHPSTAAPNAETLWKLRHAEKVTDNKARMVLRDAPPFRAGEAVEVLAEKGKDGKDKELPDSNLRHPIAEVTLRAIPSPSGEAWGTAAKGADVVIVELGGPARDWAYVYHTAGEGLYGWVSLSELEEPHGDRDYQVRALDDPQGATPRTATLKGRDLLLLPELVGMRAPDPYTLVLETDGPTPTLLDITLQQVSRPTPREVVSRWPKKWTRPGRIVTSGPFHLQAWHERDRFELVKSSTFWGRGSVRLDRVTMYTLDEQVANTNLYFQGTCDAMSATGMPATYIPAISGETGPSRRPKRDYRRAPMLSIYYYLFNVEKLTSVHLRKALAHSIDRSRLPILLKGGQIPTTQYMPGMRIRDLSDAQLAACGVSRDTPGVAVMVAPDLCYVPPSGAGFDLALAKEELELAKKELGAKFPKTITVRFNTGIERHKTIAEWIQHEWREHLGLDIQLETQEWKTYLKSTRQGEYEVARMGGVGSLPDPETEFMPNFRCNSPDNRPRYCDREFDRLLDQAKIEPDRKKRLALTRRAEQIMIDAQPIMPLFVDTQHHLQKPFVKGLAVNLYDQQSLRDTWIDMDWRATEEKAP